jgi:hypothetical protein
MGKKDKLEPLPDGFVAFHTESGERWKHKDVIPDAGGPGYRLFISDKGEERRYVFGPKDPRDSTIWDLRYQLSKAQPSGAQSPAREMGAART